MKADTLEFIWEIPIYADPEKTKEENNKKNHVISELRKAEQEMAALEQRATEDTAKIEQIRTSLGLPTEKVERTQNATEAYNGPDKEERKKLYDWSASYTLAQIAKSEGVDLASMQREEYVDYAIAHGLNIGDDQLRVAPWHRMAESPMEILQQSKERKAQVSEESDKQFAKFCFETKEAIGTPKQQIVPGIRIRSGTRDSNSWLFFGINKGMTDGAAETYKSYISVKDLNKLTPERFVGFMEALRDAGYNGDIKTFQDLIEQGVKLNDQIVMHGATREDTELALSVAEQFFGDELDQRSYGKDEIVDGKNRSYSEVLAMKIKKSVHG